MHGVGELHMMEAWASCAQVVGTYNENKHLPSSAYTAGGYCAGSSVNGLLLNHSFSQSSGPLTSMFDASMTTQLEQGRVWPSRNKSCSGVPPVNLELG